MTVTPADLHAALARYARRFHSLCGAGHHVASPLGAWLLLALCASSGAARHELDQALGVDPSGAAEFAASLLDNPHPLVASAAALWNRPVGDVAALAEWAATLPTAVTRGDLPSQALLDAWAREHTLGLFEQFPLRVTPDTMLILATALATRVSWKTPFDATPAAELGAGSAWAGQVRRALRTPDGRGHTQYIAATELAGDVAVHTAQARVDNAHGSDDDWYGLYVTSVIADADVPAGDVLAAAHQIATMSATTGGRMTPHSLFDLPLGEGPLWTVTEQTAPTTDPTGRQERAVAVLPAWSARSEHDLAHPDLGIPAAAGALARLLGMDEFRFEARQSAVARYSRVGFEAAAVSGLAVARGFQIPRDGILRTAHLRFAHPYAVVAVGSHLRRDAATGRRVPGPWHGIPVFSAWIAEVQEA